MLVLGAGGVQIVASLTLRDRAQPGSWMRLVPASAALALERSDAAWPLPQPLVLVSARAALAAGDVSRAAALVARLAPSPDRLALEGRLAQARGRTAYAVHAYLAAGDLSDVETQVASLREALRFREALALQEALVERLRGDVMQRDTLARAEYDLGGLEEATAYRYWITSATRARHQARATTAYAAAVALSPGEQLYLVAYASQLLNVRRYADARAVYLRAGAERSASAPLAAGLGQAELGLGNRAAASAALAAARRIDLADPAVRRLARDLGA